MSFKREKLFAPWAIRNHHEVLINEMLPIFPIVFFIKVFVFFASSYSRSLKYLKDSKRKRCSKQHINVLKEIRRGKKKSRERNERESVRDFLGQPEIGQREKWNNKIMMKWEKRRRMQTWQNSSEKGGNKNGIIISWGKKTRARRHKREL